jgi:group I intron endonuclease
METYGYIYITTNKINGKRYIGQHRSKEWDLKYYGSGLNINRAIKKHGIENFTCFPLAWAWNQKELDKLEIEYIAHYKPEYNIAFGGSGGWQHINCGDERSINAHKKTILNRRSYKGENHPMYGKKYSKEIRKNMGVKKGNMPWNKGKTNIFSEETKKKMSETRKGKHWYNNGIQNRQYFDNEIPDGWKLGRLFVNRPSGLLYNKRVA